jgi:pyruvate dehydrogenase E2 component (dihydrolipoamide acetyltransferase)
VSTPIAIIAEPGEEVSPQAAAPTALATPAPAAQPVAEVKPAEPITAPAGAPSQPSFIRATPLARRIASEQGVNLQFVAGSGPDGRISKRDIEAYLAAAPSQPQVSTPSAVPTPVSVSPPATFAPLTGEVPADEHVQLSRLRTAIGRRMVEVKQQVPHFYVTHAYDMSAVMELRKQLNAMLPDNEKLSVNDFIVKAVSLTLRQFPNLNASFKGDQVVRYGHVNVGVAVAVENGLLTIVCRDSDRKPLRQIAVEVRTMVARARDGKVRPDDIEGSTFSVSNLGMYEVENFIAIINPPEAAILAIGAVQEVPVVENSQVVPGLQMKASLSVDHRVSDGAEAARFLQAIKLFLKEPLRLLI